MFRDMVAGFAELLEVDVSNPWQDSLDMPASKLGFGRGR